MSSLNSNRQCVDDTFPYPVFPKDEDAIRILTIRPGDFHDPIFCTLTAVAFVNKPRYAALSYTWGAPFSDSALLPTAPGDAFYGETLCQPQATSYTSADSSQYTISSSDTVEPTRLPTINVNDTPMAIQHNLYLAMLHLRSPTHDLALWVDAICINQGDKMEVSSQVSLMSFIYSRAQTVISWLGPKEVKIHMDMFQHMSSLWKMGQSRHVGAALVRDKTSLTSRDPEHKTIARIAASTYWTRLWVVQEVCLARDLIFIYGPDVWMFDRFVNCRTLKELQAVSMAGAEAQSESYAKFRAMLRLLDCRNRRYSVRNSLESLIETFGTQSCGIVMDRIYALLGIAYDVHPVAGSRSVPDPTEFYADSIDPLQEATVRPNRGRGVLKVDYSSSVYELWVEVVKFVFFQAKSRHLTNKLCTNQTFQEQERQISIVRTAGIIQAALDRYVERDMPLMQDLFNGTILPRPPQIKAIGFLSGKLLHLGPDYYSFAGSFQATQDWFSEWQNHYACHADLERLHRLHDRYTEKLLKYTDKNMERVRDISSPHVSAWRLSTERQQTTSESHPPLCFEGTVLPRSNCRRIFLGTGYVIGLAPPAAQVGDVIVQFWNCDTALVMRPNHIEHEAIEDSIGCSASSFSLVGRADVVDQGDEKDTPVADCWIKDQLYVSGGDNVNESSGSCAVCVDLDFATLQAITASIRA